MKKVEFVGLVPAAGEGTRMYPFSRAVPKEMYPILGKPVIEHCIENLISTKEERIGSCDIASRKVDKRTICDVTW